MSTRFRPIPNHLLTPGTHVAAHNHGADRPVSLDDPAISVVTDLAYVRPFAIEPAATIDQVNNKMVACGVRLLFILDSNGELLGLITATDLLGEKPLKYIQEHGGARQEILAQDLMTPRWELEVLHFSEIEHASVGDLVETMKGLGRQHMLVVDNHGEGEEYVTGLLSTTQMEKQLGIKIELSSRAHTFAELERALKAG